MTKKIFTIVGLGEILWDMLPTGKQLGGAPTNMAFHCHQLGNRAIIASRIGQDPLGRELRQKVLDFGLTDEFLQTDQTYPTGTVEVTVSSKGQPSYVIHHPAAWDFFEATPKWQNLCAEADLICFGSLAQRHATSQQTMQQLLKISPGLKLFDVNLRQQFFNQKTIQTSLAFADILKLNDEELPIIVELCGGPTGTESQQLNWVVEHYNLKLACLTRGSRGCLLRDPHRHVEHGGVTAEVQDTVGAGDAFTATMAYLYLRQAPLETIAALANRVGAFVAGQKGGTPTMPDDLTHLITNSY